MVRLSFEDCRDGGNHCLSMCGKAEIKAVVRCLRKFTSLDWPSAFVTGGRRKRSGGLGYEVWDSPKLRGMLPAHVDRGVTIFSVRASETYRIFGFRLGDYAHILWFAREHDL